MEMKKSQALAKIAKEYENIDSAEGEIALFLESWVNHDPAAAEKILEEGKTLKGAFDAMRDAAEKKHRKKGAAYLSHREEKEATLRYYGVKDPATMLEDGLMYAFYQNCASRWAPPDAASTAAARPEAEELTLGMSFDELFG